MDLAAKRRMLISAVIFGLSGLGIWAFIARELRRAPEGYEDAKGFHLFSGQSNLPSARVTKSKNRASETRLKQPVARHA